MARKKNIKNSKDHIKSTSQVQNLAYQGFIQVHVMHGDKIISSKQYHNKGLSPLFKYICYALAGSYYSDLRPCKIKLFKCPYTGNEEINSNPSTFNWVNMRDTLSEASPYIVYDATPVVKTTESGYSTTFRFKIPFWWLYLKKFDVIGMYTDNNEACAYYLFTKEENTKWETQELEDTTGNYSLIVEWTMEVSNKA